MHEVLKEQFQNPRMQIEGTRASLQPKLKQWLYFISTYLRRPSGKDSILLSMSSEFSKARSSSHTTVSHRGLQEDSLLMIFTI